MLDNIHSFICRKESIKNRKEMQLFASVRIFGPAGKIVLNRTLTRSPPRNLAIVGG